MLKSCRNNNIVQLLDIKKTTNNSYLSLEYCNEGDVGAYLKHKKKLSEDEAVEYFVQRMTFIHPGGRDLHQPDADRLCLDPSVAIKAQPLLFLTAPAAVFELQLTIGVTSLLLAAAQRSMVCVTGFSAMLRCAVSPRCFAVVDRH